MANSLDTFAQSKLAELEAGHLRRRLAETLREDGIWVSRGGRRLLSFSCNDYLNLTHHPKVKAAAAEAVARYGAGAGASRLITGNHPLFAELEARLAQLKQAEAACVFGSGYLANAGIIPTLVGPDDLLLVDELAHACLWAGAQLSRGRVEKFRHNDVAHVRAVLAEQRAAHDHALIVTDGVFSMDGDLAPLDELAALAQEYEAWLMSDDAHGLGVLGGGRGSSFLSGKKSAVDLQMGTLSKAIGSYGGYLCASAPVIDLIKTRARTLVYSTGLPPASAAAALTALDIIEAEPELAASPVAKAQAFTRAANLPLAQSTIVPIVLGEATAALEASEMLACEGFLVMAIRPPTVPAGTARLRLAFTAGHPDEEIARLAQIVRERLPGRQAR
ncbi:MAG: 8-amino-7-oxononanoate synthase [Alphaproteobacteria bacterium]|nr:8-amino-7-oxononanoate synthase [Alphaproteobacteria bacterium]MBU6472232.1 8-amino-7-oxononanoate synthase [Alphaproteobacteria bacterium]MDE2012304.1 8-amino-7-oxononanoate synthase [Alphaproteobacteria bacterium]MDE2074917.1 8-amino-7-oxononanoate synthase [Alphaproteobacteria bacterium]